MLKIKRSLSLLCLSAMVITPNFVYADTYKHVLVPEGVYYNVEEGIMPPVELPNVPEDDIVDVLFINSTNDLDWLLDLIDEQIKEDEALLLHQNAVTSNIVVPYKNIDVRFSQELQAKDVTKEAFIPTLLPLAIATQQKYNIRASVLIAQSILESNWGTSGLALEANNYFGLKKVKGYKGINLNTQEYVQGSVTNQNANFTVFSSVNESVDYYGYAISNFPRYANIKTATNVKEYIQAIKNGGYASDPKYVDKVLSIIKKYDLEKYDSLTV